MSVGETSAGCADILERMSDAFLRLDREWRVASVNANAERLLGRARGELIGAGIWDAFPEVVDTPLYHRLRDAVEEEADADFEERLPTTGERLRIRAWSDDDGISILLREEPRCGEAEEALERFRILSHYARDIILFVRTDGRIIEANDTAVDTYGYTREELLGLSIYDLRAPGTRAATTEQMAKADEKGILFETQHRRKDGSTFPVEVSSQGAEIRGERVLLSIIRDITERRQSEEALRESEERFRGAVEGLLDPFGIGIPVRDEAGRIVDFCIEYANRPALEFLGVTAEEFIGGRLTETLSAIREIGLFEMYSRVAETGVPLILDGVPFERTVQGARPGRTVDLRVSRIAGPRVVVSWRDVTARVLGDRALRAERARLRTVLATLPVGVLIADASGRIVEINAAGKKIWGEDAPYAAGISEYVAYKGWRAETGEPLEAEDWPLARALTHAETIIGEVIDIERFDGTLGTVLNSAAPIRDDAGSIVGAVVAVQDITDIRLAEEEVRRSRDFLESIIDNTPAAVYIKDLEGRIILANQAIADLFGLRKDDMIGKTSFDFYRRDVAEDHTANDREIIRRGEAVTFEEVAPENGTDRTFLSIKFPLEDPDGHIYAVGGVSSEITDRVHAEEALREVQQDLSRAQAVSRTGSWRIDTRRNELRWSDEAYRIFDIPIGTPLTYESFLDRVHPDDREYVDARWKAALTGEPYEIEHRVCAGGEVKWVRETAELEFDAEGRLMGGFGTVVDITDRKAIEQELLRSREEISHALDRESYFSRQLQRALLPPEPEVGPGYSVGHVYVPAFAGREVGGDFYDVFRTESGCVGIVMGDVSGKGIEAASVASATRATLRAFAYDLSYAGEAMTHANAVMCAQQPASGFGFFVTAFLAILHPDSGDISYANAGHPPGVVRRGGDGEIELLAYGSPPIGLIPGYRFTEGTARLAPGDRLVLYTDGLSEARSEWEMFEVEGIERVLREHGAEPPQELVAALLSAAMEWADGRVRDDTAIVVLGRSD